MVRAVRVLLTFFGGYDLYIIAIISPLEPERGAEAHEVRRSAELVKKYFEVFCKTASNNFPFVYNQKAKNSIQLQKIVPLIQVGFL